MLDFPAIPDPGNTIESVADSVRSLKHAVETLTSQTGEQGGEAAHVFRQATPPTEFLNGAIWINTASGNQIYAWDPDSGQWMNTTAKPTSGSVDLSPYVLKTGDTMSGTLIAPRFQVDANAAFYSDGNVVWTADAGDYCAYIRAGNYFQWVIGSAQRMSIDGGGAVTAGGSFYANGSCFIGGGDVIVATNNGGGGVYFRPFGPGDGSYQAYVEHTGRFVAENLYSRGAVNFATTLQSYGSDIIMAGSGGYVYFRPHGAGNGGYQCYIQNDGRMVVGGRVFCNGPSNTAGGHVMIDVTDRIYTWGHYNTNSYLDVNIQGGGYGVTFFASDLTMKQDVVPTTTDILPIIEQIDFIDYRWKPYPGDVEAYVDSLLTPTPLMPPPPSDLKVGGYAAQQLQTLKPDWVNVSDSSGKLIPDANVLLSNAFKALQESYAMIKSLQARVDALEANAALPATKILTAAGNGFTLPAGGVWMWFGVSVLNNGRLAGQTESGVSPGGTAIMPPLVGSHWTGFYRRVS